jgi:hypothetical protein
MNPTHERDYKSLVQGILLLNGVGWAATTELRPTRNDPITITHHHYKLNIKTTASGFGDPDSISNEAAYLFYKELQIKYPEYLTIKTNVRDWIATQFDLLLKFTGLPDKPVTRLYLMRSLLLHPGFVCDDDIDVVSKWIPDFNQNLFAPAPGFRVLGKTTLLWFQAKSSILGHARLSSNDIPSESEISGDQCDIICPKHLEKLFDVLGMDQYVIRASSSLKTSKPCVILSFIGCLATLMNPLDFFKFLVTHIDSIPSK